MLFIWGKKHVYRRLGYVADFCPLCRTICAFEVRRIGLAGHIYYVSLGEGELVGNSRTCRSCKTVLNASIERYREISKKELPLRRLMDLTFPNLGTYWATRLDLEKRLRTPLAVPLSAEDRKDLIREPFALLAGKVEEHFASGLHLDWQMGATIVALIFLAPFTWGLLSRFAPEREGAIIIGLLVLSVVAIGVQIFLGSGRYMSKNIYPVLARALQPLKPTKAELQAAIRDLKTNKAKIAGKTNFDDLLAKIRDYVPPRKLAPGEVAK